MCSAACRSRSGPHQQHRAILSAAHVALPLLTCGRLWVRQQGETVSAQVLQDHAVPGLTRLCALAVTLQHWGVEAGHLCVPAQAQAQGAHEGALARPCTRVPLCEEPAEAVHHKFVVLHVPGEQA